MTNDATEPLIHEVSNYRDVPLTEELSCLLVVKSQDQERRRARMLRRSNDGPLGRVEQRPIEEGLLVKCTLTPSGIVVERTKTFPEPRHLIPYRDGYLLTVIDRVLQLSHNWEVLREYRDPHFAFLHTVALHPTAERMLIVSSGYDAVLELSLTTGERTWEWFAWDHGFNPSADGVYLASTPEKAAEYEAAGLPALYIDPAHYGPLGIVTAKRTAHPNAATYNPYTATPSVIISMAHKGSLYEVNQAGKKKHRCTLHRMAHGIRPFADGWLVTDTTVGEAHILDQDFRARERIILSGLPKAPELAKHEWVQLVLPLPATGATGHRFLCLDANRGLLIIDTERRTRSLLSPNPSWCIQDAFLGGH